LGALLLLVGAPLMSYIAIKLYWWRVRLVEQGRFAAAWQLPLVSLVATMILTPAALLWLGIILSPKGYVLQPGELSGPLGDGDITLPLVLLLWPFGIVLALIYAFAAMLRAA
jgi:hypothetical protein